MKRTKSNFFNDLYNQPYDYNAKVKLYNSCKGKNYCFFFFNCKIIINNIFCHVSFVEYL